MKKLICIALLLTSSTASAMCFDRYGNPVMCQQHQINIYQDRYGNTTGFIGNNNVNLHTDRFGTTGNIGGSPVNIWQDRFGTTITQPGQPSIKCWQDRFGVVCR